MAEINYGVLPLAFVNPADYDRVARDDVLAARNLRRTLEHGGEIANWRRKREKVAPRKAS